MIDVIIIYVKDAVELKSENEPNFESVISTREALRRLLEDLERTIFTPSASLAVKVKVGERSGLRIGD